MHAPTTTLHRGQHTLLAAFVALTVAGGTVGVVAITSNDGTSGSSSPSPSVAKVVPDRVLDGSPILRGTANAVATDTRVLDGSPILRGHAAAFAVAHPSSVQGTLRPPSGRPFGFRNVP